MATEVRVPTLGESVTEATVATWFKKPGDAVKVDEMLCELETDKVTIEVPCPVAGAMGELVAAEGDVVEKDGLLCMVEEGASGSVTAAPAAAASAPAAPTAAASAPPSSGRTDIEDAPSAKKAMADAGLSRDQVQGTGRDGRVMKDDVARATAGGAVSAGAAIPQSQREERVKMTRLRQTIAKRLKEAQDTAAMLTTFNEVDMTEVMALRSEYKELFQKKHGVKLGFMSFFAKAAVEGLKRYPAINSEIRGDKVIMKNYHDIGIAIGGGKGLVVPILRNVERMSFADVERKIGEYAALAKENKVVPDDLKGGTFTISNGGVYGSLLSTPIVNPPQSGILGLHTIQDRPIALNGQVVIRPMMYVALTYDHRMVDGKEAVGFLKTIKEVLEEPARLFLEV